MFSRALYLSLSAAVALCAQAPNPEVHRLAAEGHYSPERWEGHSALLGKRAPKLQLGGWLSGKVTPKDMEGKIVVVDFWATWSGPCIRAIPHNNRVASKYAAKGVIFVGVCGSCSGQSMMPTAVKKAGITYPVARTTPSTEEAWKIAAYPTYGVVDRKGILRALGIRGDYVERVVDALLAEDDTESR